MSSGFNSEVPRLGGRPDGVEKLSELSDRKTYSFALKSKDLR